MNNGKSNKNRKRKSDSKNMQSLNITLPENLTPDEMQHIIAQAIIEADEIKETRELKKREEKIAQWQATIGYKECEKKLSNFLNRIKVFFKILFLPEKKIEGNRASSVLLKMFIHLFFWLMKLLFAVLALYLFLHSISPLINNTNSLPWYQNIIYLPYSFFSFVISRLFRMASIEIDKNENKNYLSSIFACIASVISIIIAVIALVKGG